MLTLDQEDMDTREGIADNEGLAIHRGEMINLAVSKCNV